MRGSSGIAVPRVVRQTATRSSSPLIRSEPGARRPRNRTSRPVPGLSEEQEGWHLPASCAPCMSPVECLAQQEVSLPGGVVQLATRRAVIAEIREALRCYGQAPSGQSELGPRNVLQHRELRPRLAHRAPVRPEPALIAYGRRPGQRVILAFPATPPRWTRSTTR